MYYISFIICYINFNINVIHFYGFEKWQCSNFSVKFALYSLVFFSDYGSITSVESNLKCRKVFLALFHK